MRSGLRWTRFGQLCAAIVATITIVLGLGCGAPASAPTGDLQQHLAEIEAQLASGELESAYVGLERMALQYPDRDDLVVSLVATAMGLQDSERALPLLEDRIAAGEGELFRLLDLQGTLLESAGRSGEAEQAYRDALVERPGLAASSRKLSRLLGSRGRSEEAIQVAADGLAHNPDDGVLQDWYGEVLYRVGRFEEAEGHLSGLVEGETARARSLYLLGLVALRSDEPTRAVEHLERASRLDPDNVEIWYQLANAYGRRGDTANGDAENERRSLERFAAVRHGVAGG